MSYYVRRLNSISNWTDRNAEINREAISADAISELKTANNQLSWWELDDIDDDSKIEKLAAAMFSTMNYKIGEICLVMIPSQDISADIKLVSSPKNGNSAVKGISCFHYDMVDLNYGKIGIVAETIASHTANGDGVFVKIITSKKLVEKLKQLLDEKQVDEKKLGKYVKEKLGLESV